ncbi:pyridoxal phosphate-dependent aminotransferase [Gloeobacter violaceus]|uniref:Aminotransferase n=1 Tax=Gloeobacter violaceus (strain ATCC 29082 / PCC 7421) TaxID=251221 RepID=Q7NHD7_GLOVI|nr:pyridoxal phosphate-dependent aminotransferase [Gloeobacter violaceus]BAC90541.1 aspartate aminotransferase [Gloeobacter violaceus PCC 7421]
MSRLATRVASLTPSLTLAIAAKAKALAAGGVDVCGLSAGEPDFDTPAPIKAAAKAALDRGETKYGPVAGQPRLRERIARKLERENGLPYTPEQILVTNGGKQGLYNAIMALIEPGDAVLIPSPYWLSYPEMVSLAGGTSVLLPTTEATGFKITPEQLEAAITPRTRLLILNSPSNPTGMVYSRPELEAITEVVLRHDLMVLSDEIYEKLVYDGARHHSIGGLGREMFARTITSGGFSKAFAMTGWRLGYLAGPTDLIGAAGAIQSHSTSNVAAYSQAGALAALEDPQVALEVERMVRVFAERRTAMYDAVAAIPGLRCARAQGAFYLLPDISATGLNSTAFCEQLLDQFHVAAVPGIAFGSDSHVRLSYATDLDTIYKGVERLGQFVRQCLAVRA